MNKYVPFLSKSRFIKGMQCHKALWLQTHRPTLKDDISDDTQAVFDAGHDVGRLAQQMFPGGVEVPFDNVPLAEQIQMTRDLIDSGRETIFEAAFSFDNVFIKADLLTKHATGWHLGEVKSSTEAKEHYINDIAVQYHVITSSGIPIEKASLVLINTSYVRNGEIEPEKLFAWVDVTDEVLRRQEAIRAEIANQQLMLKTEMPGITIGPQCQKPYSCDFMGYCWADVPENSVFDFADKGCPDLFRLYHQGFTTIKDIPPGLLGWRQKLQQECFLSQSSVIDKNAVSAFIDSLWYPLAFLDFETTCFTPVPLFDGTRPYQQVPFQFSLHIQDNPGAELRHLEFLAPAGEPPQESFLKALLAAVPENACVLTWNATFEKRIMRESGSAYPEFKPGLQKIMLNVVDLMMPFMKKQIYHWEFAGSYSIKMVLPVLVPELSYKNLAVSDGATAATTWLKLSEIEPLSEREIFEKALLEYCCLDTLAMVKILEKMKEMV